MGMIHNIQMLISQNIKKATFLLIPMNCPIVKIIHPIAININPIATGSTVCFSIHNIIAIISPIKFIIVPIME